MKNIIWLVLASFMLVVIGCAADDASDLPTRRDGGPSLEDIDLDASLNRTLGEKRQYGVTAFDGDTDPHWVDIVGDVFNMGHDNAYANELPVHSVTVGNFEIMRGEINASQFHQCVLAGLCDAPPFDIWADPVYEDTDTTDTDSGPGTVIIDTDTGVDVHCYYDFYTPGRFSSYDPPGGLPMTCMTHLMAEQFCAWVDPTNNSRLPSEAEWEFAARSGGQDYQYPWSWDTDDPDTDTWADCDHTLMRSSLIPEEAYIGCDYGYPWLDDGPCGGSYPYAYNATAQDVCDMAGNAAEWVADVYHPTYDGAPTDGSAWMDATDVRDDIYVIRGGHSGNFAGWVRTTSRSYVVGWANQTARSEGHLGARCVRDDVP